MSFYEFYERHPFACWMFFLIVIGVISEIRISAYRK